MQKAVINAEGVHFAYIDSGPSPGDNMYTTVVCIHGLRYSALSFARLLPSAAEHNLRVIALNRRDYAGSSHFTDEELAPFDGDSQDPARRDEEFLRKRGLEIAEFLVWIIDELKIPKASANRPSGTSGGLVVLGWSLGTSTALAFFAHLSSYPSAIREKISRYLRTLVLYDPPLSVLGYPLPEEEGGGAYHPYTDPTIPKSELPLALARFMTSYYTHPYYTAFSDGDGEMAEEKKYAMLQTKPPCPGEARRSATSDASPAILSTIDDEPYTRSEKVYLRADPAVLQSLLSRSLLLLDSDSNSKSSIGVKNSAGEDGLFSVLRSLHSRSLLSVDPEDEDDLFSSVNVRILHGTDTLWGIVWGIWELEKELDRWEEEGKKMREISFTKMDGANHFMHWDEADRFLGIIASGL